jgi:hypothetical protein
MLSNQLPRRILLAGANLLFLAGIAPLDSLASSASSTNFIVRAFDQAVDCQRIAADCETLRNEWLAKWHHSAPLQWSPRCEIVIHFTRASYRAQVGPGSDQSSGSSLIRFAKTKVAHRRIDLLANESGQLSALAHELTHVVLADLFDGCKPPPWFDEGIATLADSASKQSLHYRDCRDAVESGTAFGIDELFELKRLRGPDQVAAFYGQSLSLTQFLSVRKEPQRIVAFVKHAMEFGYPRAIREHYGFESVAALEQAWRQFERRTPAVRQGQPSSDLLTGEPFARPTGINTFE